MNYKKTKIMIFNKGSKLIKCSFSVNDYKLECVKEYKYLGLLIGCGGNFSTAISDLVNRGQKAFFKVKSIFKYGIPSIHTILKAFDHTTAKFEALLPAPRILLHKFKFSFSIL
jgi:hypothetical protein